MSFGVGEGEVVHPSGTYASGDPALNPRTLIIFFIVSFLLRIKITILKVTNKNSLTSLVCEEFFCCQLSTLMKR